jgi:long-chain acyl-CoA synthetase
VDDGRPGKHTLRLRNHPNVIVELLSYDTLGPENIPYVFNQTQVETCFCSKQSAEIMLRTKNLHNVKNVVCFDHIPEEMVEEFKKKGVKVYFLEELIQKGDHSAHRQKYVDPKPDDVLTFCYTSGTTGPPKGAMLSHKNISSFCAVLKTNRDCDFQPNDSYLSYLPLAHVLERLALFAVSCFGCSIAYYSGDVQKINLDLAVVKPTFFVSVPRLFNRIHEAVESKFSKVTGWKKTLLEKGLSTKIANLEKSGTVTHPVFDRLIFKNTKEAFGGNVRLMISGSAPLLPHVENFIKVISSSILLEGYGQTESTGASFVTNSNDPTCGHVGGPTVTTLCYLGQYRIQVGGCP